MIRKFLLCPFVILLLTGFAIGRCTAATADEVGPPEPSPQEIEIPGGAFFPDKWDIRPFVQISHTSALTRGEPFRPELDETSVDRVEVGFTARKGRWHIDLSQGWKCIGCDRSQLLDFAEESTTVTLRYYFGGQD